MAGIFDWLKKKAEPAAEPAKREAPPSPRQADGRPRFSQGQTIGGEYTVREAFQGGMGTVYVVTHRAQRKPFILKEPRVIDDETRRIFLREAEAWVRVGLHPNVVQAFWVRSLQGGTYVAAEFVPADESGRRSLRDWMKSGKPPVERVVAWTAQAIYGLRHSTAMGVPVHRDIKPENLLVDLDGGLRVTDFGLACLRGGAGGGASPLDGVRGLTSVGGTPGYMPPEQLRGSAAVDLRADIYALGVTVFELVYGRHPFAARTVGELMLAHLEQEASVPPGPFRDMIASCLSKQPAGRPASYDALLRLLASGAAASGCAVPGEVHFQNAETENLLVEARSWTALGQPQRALDAARAYTDRAPGEARGWTELGRLLAEAGQIGEAQAATVRSIQLNPVGSPAWNNLGIIRSRAGDHVGAVDAFTRAIRLDPGNTGPRLNIAHSLSIVGRMPEALSHLEIAAQLASEKASIWTNLGAMYSEVGRIDDARRCLMRALELDPKQSEAAENLRRLDSKPLQEGALPLMHAGKFDQAIILLAEAVRRDPSDHASWHNLGLCYLQREDVGQAERCFSNVASLNPRDAFALKQLARLNYTRGDIQRAMNLCVRLESLRDGAADGVALRAQILQGTGRHAEALVILRNYLSNAPTQDSVWFVLGDVHARAGEFREAIEAFSRAEALLVSASSEDHSRAGPHLASNLAGVRDALRQCRAAVGRG